MRDIRRKENSMNVKSTIVGLTIAVVASTGTYFLLPPPSRISANNCATTDDVKRVVEAVIVKCLFTDVGERGDRVFTFYPNC